MPDLFRAGADSTTFSPASVRTSNSVRILISAHPSSFERTIFAACVTKGSTPSIAKIFEPLILKRALGIGYYPKLREGGRENTNVNGEIPILFGTKEAVATKYGVGFG